MAIKIEATGNTIADAVASLGCTSLVLGGFDTETLIAEVRERLAQDGQVVKIVPFED